MPKKLDQPSIFDFHDYREFLRAWLSYLKKSDRKFSLRALARKSEIASGYLPTVLSGERHISEKALSKLLLNLGLGRTEQSYLKLLVQLGASDNQKVRLEALEGMKRFGDYRRKNPKEAEVHQYLTHWYYVAIREMSALPDFRLEPRWIQKRLREFVPLSEIEGALVFLKDSGFIRVNTDGTAEPPEKNLDCMGGVYRLALGQYHRENLDLAARSIQTTPSEERAILGHTFAFSKEKFLEARKILEDAQAKLKELEAASQADRTEVYQAELALFPLTKQGDSENDDK